MTVEVPRLQILEVPSTLTEPLIIPYPPRGMTPEQAVADYIPFILGRLETCNADRAALRAISGRIITGGGNEP